MRQTLVPVLLLAAVALSSSNILPTTDRFQPIANGQHNDNTLSNRYNSRDLLNNVFYTVPFGAQRSRLLSNLAKLQTNSEWAEYDDKILNEEDNYDGEGFRKEQWHNYPRQLDRLHAYLTEYHKGDTKRSNTDDPGPEDYETGSKEILSDESNEYLLDNNGKSTYESDIAATNPLLIFKVHLTCLSNQLKNSQSTDKTDSFQTPFNIEKVPNDVEENLFTNEINPASKVKREGVTSQQNANSDGRSPGNKKTKRLFSLWSRLQGMAHKGHELPHRRHLAFYGFPDNDGGGTLTAETRAMIRPPGSPLRYMEDSTRYFLFWNTDSRKAMSEALWAA